MSSVIHVRFSTPAERQAGALGPLIENFARARRATTDAFWLKENGELLNILESTNANVPSGLLAPHEATYDRLQEQMAFFPQYYRFLLSIALDLEALGMPGEVGERLCDAVLAQGLIEGETSDIQRLEARRLLARRGRTAPVDASLQERMHAFIATPNRFALPNKKAAYELTHIVFYLTEYGRRRVTLGDEVRQSLENVGIWAFLDGNTDLLAEICIAMRYLSHNYNEVWDDWIASEMQDAEISYAPEFPRKDGYHCLFMGSWLAALRGAPAFSDLPMPQEAAPRGAMVMTTPSNRRGALREISQTLYALGSERSADWDRMERRLCDALSDTARDQLQSAVRTAEGFARFFESFARAAPCQGLRDRAFRA